MIELGARILAPGADIAVLALHAGLAYAIAGLLAAFPVHAARGQLYLPLDILQRHGTDRVEALGGRPTPELHAALVDLRGEARGHLDTARAEFAAAPPEVVPALLPVALVPATLERMERPGYDPFVPIEIPQWRRQWRLLRAARRPARMFG